MHQNIRSLTSKVLPLEVVLVTNNVDVLLITEHWLSPMGINSIHLPNYKMCSSFCRTSNVHGGSAIFCKNKINYKVIDVKEYCIESVIECSCIELLDFSITVIVVYRPPSADFCQFLEYFCALLSKFENTSSIIIGGDFNVDRLKNTVNKLMLDDLLVMYDLKPTINIPTRINENTATCIDNIFVNVDLVDYIIENINFSLSDHYTQILNFDVYRNNNEPNEPKFITKRNICKQNIDRFNDLLANENWENVFLQTCPNLAFNEFADILSYYFEICFPLQRLKLNKKRSRPMWISEELLELKQRVCLFSDLAQKYPELKPICKNVNTEYKNKLKESKIAYNDNKIFESTNKVKTMWNMINEVVGKSSASQTKIEVYDNDGSLLPNKLIADNFNVHFTTSHIGVQAEPIDLNLLNENIPLFYRSFFLQPVTELDTFLFIGKLKSSHSSGLDNMSNNLLKQCKNSLVLPLTYLINLCFVNGIFPDNLKVSKVIPLFKKGDKNSYNNYRAISLISSISKVIELAFLEQLSGFFLKNNLLSSVQHGFLKNKSVDTALVNFHGSVVDALDKGLFAFGLFIDYSRAFDCVDYDLLIAKLFRYGIRGPALNFLSSYIKNRSQVVYVNGTEGNKYPINAGVPQGSILGPFIYLVFANDLALHIKSKFNVHITCYADDTNFLVVQKSPDAVMNVSKDLYRDIIIWSEKNRLTLNKEKTATVSFRYNIEPNHTDEFLIADSVKILGVIFDRNLTWAAHIDSLCAKLGKGCYGMRNLKNHCSKDTLLTFYYSNIHSHLRYGIMLWGLSTTYARRAFILQKRVIRIMESLHPRESCRESFKTLKILTLTGIYIYEICCYVFKNKSTFLTNQTNHNYQTRFKGQLIPHQHSTALYQKSVFYNGCKIYNHLPADIKNSNSLFIFKKRIKNLLIEMCLYDVNEFYSV